MAEGARRAVRQAPPRGAVHARHGIRADAGPVRGVRQARLQHHHVARRSWGKTFRLVTPNGVWELRSPLFALCGSGTTGCHGKFHDGGLRAEWVWRTGAAEEAWWSGTLLREYPPHSPDLYMFGYWAITDRYGNEIIREVK